MRLTKSLKPKSMGRLTVSAETTFSSILILRFSSAVSPICPPFYNDDITSRGVKMFLRFKHTSCFYAFNFFIMPTFYLKNTVIVTCRPVMKIPTRGTFEKKEQQRNIIFFRESSCANNDVGKITTHFIAFYLLIGCHP